LGLSVESSGLLQFSSHGISWVIQQSSMGLQRRKANQLSEAEAKATEAIAAQHKQGTRQQRHPAPQPRSQLVSYVITVVLACMFWMIYQQLHKHSLHLA
jgi:dipeptide/tripeptide permease